MIRRLALLAVIWSASQAVIFGLGGVGSAWAQAPQAWIVEVQPRVPASPLASGIARNGKEKPALLLEPLYAGDRLFARDPAARIVIETADRERITIDSLHPTYTVEGASGALASTVEALSLTMKWANSAQLARVARPVDSIGRTTNDEAGNEENSNPMALLENTRDPLKIAPIGGPLWIGWSGGKPPFRITLSDGSQEPLSVLACEGHETSCPREVVLILPSPPPALATLTVVDATGSNVTRKLAAITEKAPPPVKADLADIDQLIAIVEIVDRGGGRAWSLEAARRLLPLADRFPPARAMLDGFRDGALP
jgi:hypothetical protein